MSRSKDDFKWITKWLFLFSALMTLFFIWLATKQEQYETKAPVVLPSPTPTVEPDIVFINGVLTVEAGEVLDSGHGRYLNRVPGERYRKGTAY